MFSIKKVNAKQAFGNDIPKTPKDNNSPNISIQEESNNWKIRALYETI